MSTRSLALTTLLTLLIATAAQAQTAQYYFAELRGSNEVPATNSQVVGAALITIDSNNLMTFEVNTPGIVSPTASHIHNNVAGQNAGVFIGFTTTTTTFSNGRLKGTIQLDASKTDPIRANPAGFYVNVHTSANGGGEIRGQLAPATEQDIAIAGNVTTGAGDKFVTDVRVFNPSATNKVVALVEYFAAGVANVNSTASKTIELAPRGEAVLDDVTGAAGLNSTGTIGALRVTSNTGLLVTSNIYNDQRGATPNRGTFGQFVPAIARANALTKGVVLHLSNKDRDPANPSGFRTNIGFFNPNQGAATVNVTLRDAAGTSIGTTAVVLPGLSQQQNAITSYFPGVNLANAAAVTLSFDSTLPIFVYGAVNDNISGDSILVPAQPDVP